MLKNSLLLCSVCALLLVASACSNADAAEQASDNSTGEKIDEMIVRIVGISDTPNDEWLGFTVFAENERGKMAFNHEYLDDIGATIGDKVKIITTDIWLETDPMHQFHLGDETPYQILNRIDDKSSMSESRLWCLHTLLT